MQIQATQLKKSLSQFGLNPTDWNVQLGRRNTALVQNKEDKEIVMIGEIKQIKSSAEADSHDEQIVFKDLQLLSF